MSSELSQAQQEQQPKKYTLAGLLASDIFARKLGEIMGNEENVKRFVQIGLQTIKRNHKLAECSQATVFDSLLKLSQLGLEPDGYHAHLVPFNNKVKYVDEQGKEREKWELQCQLITDYKGLINVIRRNPKVSIFKGGVIKVQDKFVYREGSERYFSHEPVFPKPGVKLDNPIALVYAFIKWTNGDWDVDILTVDEVERIRERSRAKDFGPWVTDWAEMAMKTAIRHISKRLELSYEERSIITADDDQFGYQNPFEAQAPKLTYTRPEFSHAAATEEVQSVDRSISTDDRQKPAENLGRTKAEPDKSRKRGDQRGKAEQQEAEKSEQQATKEQAGSVQNGIQQATEKDYKFGPADDGGSRQEPAAADNQQPADSTSTAREGERTDEVSAGSTKQESDQGVSVGQDANAEERQKANQNLAKLIKNIQKDKVSEEKVVSVLMSFDRDTGFAAESGKVSDLPDEAIDICVRNWGSILFNIKKGASEG